MVAIGLNIDLNKNEMHCGLENTKTERLQIHVLLHTSSSLSDAFSVSTYHISIRFEIKSF